MTMRMVAYRGVMGRSFAELVGGDHTALVLISHGGVERRELPDLLHGRWLDVVLKKPGVRGVDVGDGGRRSCRTRQLPEGTDAVADRGSGMSL
jgi:hypothetical protein